MKRLSLLLLLTVVCTLGAEAQRRHTGLIYRGKQWLIPCVDMCGGYIWDHKYDKYTVSTTFNNIYWERFGLFAMFEMDWAAPALVTGPTVSINDFAYVYGGIDFVTDRGMFARGGITHARKDLGIGFYPIRYVTVKICHSFNAGSRAEIGIRLPLEKEPEYYRQRNRRK